MATLKPPYTFETATQKVKTAQNLWNTCDPIKVAKAYTTDCIWRNRHWFVKGTAEIEDLLTRKWERETSYRLRKELFAFENRKIGQGADERWEGRIAVQFWYEYRDKEDGMKWKRCYGLEDWTYSDKVSLTLLREFLSSFPMACLVVLKWLTLVIGWWKDEKTHDVWK